MCGRFALFATGEQIAEAFQLSEAPAVAPRYNIAPTQPVLAVRRHTHSGQREAVHFRWGLVPFWADDIKIGNRLINARSETAAEKPAFRAAFKRRRCLVPISGFYEWQARNGAKQPYFIHPADGGVFAIAGLWEHWQDASGSELETCTLLTIKPNELMADLHNRMPVIVEPEDYDVWLSTVDDQPAPAEHLLRPYPAAAMAAYPVSTFVNRPQNDSAECIARV